MPATGPTGLVNLSPADERPPRARAHTQLGLVLRKELDEVTGEHSIVRGPDVPALESTAGLKKIETTCEGDCDVRLDVMQEVRGGSMTLNDVQLHSQPLTRRLRIPVATTTITFQREQRHRVQRTSLCRRAHLQQSRLPAAQTRPET